jgi:hypothetical protein
LGYNRSFRGSWSRLPEQLRPWRPRNGGNVGHGTAGNQEFLYTDLQVARQLSGTIQGVFGEEFLTRFDYLLDFKNHRLDFGDVESEGIRVKCRSIDGVPSVFTSLGWLVLDSGADHLVLFGAKPAQITHLL